MAPWLSWLFEPEGAEGPEGPNLRQELRLLRRRRRELFNDLSSLRAFGFDTLASEDEAALRSLDRRIQALQRRKGSSGNAGASFPGRG